MVFRDGVKQLWNPILKKSFKIRPEERVRLQLLEYLIEEAGFSASRISFESPVNLPHDKSVSRTDLICYTKTFTPLLLVECKAPEVRLNEKAALQISRYNQRVGAPFLLISNGREDHWFEIDQDKVTVLKQIPAPFDPTHKPNRNFGYWVSRGFAGSKSHPDIRAWVLESCSEIYLEGTEHPFLAFEGSEPALSLANYYRIMDGEGGSKLAVGLSSTSIGTTRLNVILNENGNNTALLSASLDLIADKETESSILHSHKGIFQPNLCKAIGFSFDQPLKDLLPKLNNLLRDYT